MTCMCVAVAALSVYVHLRALRLLRARVDAVEERAATCERTVADACAAAMAAAGVVRDAPATSTGDEARTPPQVLGYGQTRTRARRMLYRDVRDEDGTVRREWLAALPLPPAGEAEGAEGAPLVGAGGAKRP